MDIDTLFKFRNCCFCLSLRTGCILIALLHVAFGGLFFFIELANAIMVYHWSKSENRLTVMFAEDITATFLLFFSCCFLHGVRKENKNLIYIGSVMSTYFVISQIYFFLTIILKNMFHYFMYYEHTVTAALSGLCCVFEALFCVIILNYHKEVRDKTSTTYLQMASEGENEDAKNNPHNSNQSLENKNLIYIGSVMSTYFVISQIHFCLRIFLKDMFHHFVYFEHTGTVALSALCCVFEALFCVIILNYHKEVREKTSTTYLQMASEGENEDAKNNPHNSNQSLVN